MTGYGELCEHYAGEGLSGPDASNYASNGVRPDFDEPEPEDNEQDYE